MSVRMDLSFMKDRGSFLSLEEKKMSSPESLSPDVMPVDLQAMKALEVCIDSLDF